MSCVHLGSAYILVIFDAIKLRLGSRQYYHTANSIGIRSIGSYHGPWACISRTDGRSNGSGPSK